jgi:hypothetical protein
MNLLGRATALAGAMVLAGCTEYLDRRESVSFGAGDAQQVNLITHVVTPLPSHAADRDLWFHGEPMANAVERYRTGETAEATADAGASGAATAPAGGDTP